MSMRYNDVPGKIMHSIMVICSGLSNYFKFVNRDV